MAKIGEEVNSSLVSTSVVELNSELYIQRQTFATSMFDSYIVTDGALRVSGRNNFGQLGLGDTTQRSSFVTAIASGVRSVSAGGNSAYIIKDDGTLWSCGYGGTGQLGLGNSASVSVFTYTGISDVRSVHAGAYFVYVLKNDGTLWSCGANNVGQLGLGDVGLKMVNFTKVAIDSVYMISTGAAHAIAIKNNGDAYGVGANDKGQLGLGVGVEFSLFEYIAIDDARYVSCGGSHSAIIKNDNTLWVTGSNTYGQLGIASVVSQNTFILSTTITNVSTVSCGTEHTLATEGTVLSKRLVSTGRNIYGQLALGGGDITQRTSFTPTTYSSVSALSANDHNLMTVDGSLAIYGSGRGTYGQLGGNSTTTVNASMNLISGGADTNKMEVKLYTNGQKLYSGANLYVVNTDPLVAISQYYTLSLVGSSNPYKPFDSENNTPATANNSMTYIVKSLDKFNGFALAKVLATSLTYTFRFYTYSPSYPLWLDGVAVLSGGNGIVKTGTVGIDCKRDADGILSLYPTSVSFDADIQMDKFSTVELTLTHDGEIQLGDLVMHNSVHSGFANMDFSHSVHDWNDYTPDVWGSIPEATKAKVTKFDVTMDIYTSNYDYAVSFDESILGKNVIIDANGSTKVFNSLVRRVRVTNVSSKPTIKDGDLWKMAGVIMSVQEVV